MAEKKTQAKQTEVDMTDKDYDKLLQRTLIVMRCKEGLWANF